MTNVGNAQREIRKIAYALWTEQGQPEGRDREHWETAKEIWSFRNRETPAGGAGIAEDQPVSSRAADAGKPGKTPRHG